MNVSFEEALELADKDERFRATVYAINTLLVHKGVYTHEEFEAAFVEWVSKHALRTEEPLRSGEAASRV